MTSTRRMSATCALALGCWIGSGGCADDSAARGSNGDVIRIGVFLREGGDSSDEILAVRQINAAGGITIDGESFTLELVRVFDGASAEGGARAVERFVEQGAVAAIGPRWSSIVLGDAPDHANGAAQAAIEHDLIMVTGSATSAAITTLDDHDLVWRTVPSDDIQGEVGARYAYEDAGARSAAILYRDDAWGTGLATTFEGAFEALGGTITAVEGFDPELDFAGYAFPELDGVFEAQPDLVYLLAFNETSQITHRVVQGGYLAAYGDQPPLFMATDGSYDTNTLNNSAPEVVSRLVGTVPGPTRSDPVFADYLEAFEEAGLGPGDTAWPYPYDAVYVVALAIQAAQSTATSDIKAELRAISTADDGDVRVGPGDWADARAALEDGEGIDYDGASGPIEFTAQGDPGRGYYSIWQVGRDDDGAFVFERDEDSSIDF